MSKQSVYALRTSARGQGFAMGLAAANLLQRDVLADELMDRALHGVKETVESDDGRITTRHRYDNRLGPASAPDPPAMASPPQPQRYRPP